MEIVFPNNNEKAFISLAERLGVKEMVLVYPFEQFAKKELPKGKVILKLGIVAKQQDILEAKKLSRFVIVESGEKDQYTLEKMRPHLMFNFEKSSKKDKTHYRISGLNQVLCKLAASNNITVGFSFSELLHASPRERKVLLGRMMQNMRFCKKYKVKTLFASFAKKPFEMRNERDLKALASLMGKNL